MKNGTDPAYNTRKTMYIRKMSLNFKNEKFGES